METHLVRDGCAESTLNWGFLQGRHRQGVCHWSLSLSKNLLKILRRGTFWGRSKRLQTQLSEIKYVTSHDHAVFFPHMNHFCQSFEIPSVINLVLKNVGGRHQPTNLVSCWSGRQPRRDKLPSTSASKVWVGTPWWKEGQAREKRFCLSDTVAGQRHRGQNTNCFLPLLLSQVKAFRLRHVIFYSGQMSSGCLNDQHPIATTSHNFITLSGSKSFQLKISKEEKQNQESGSQWLSEERVVAKAQVLMVEM